MKVESGNEKKDEKAEGEIWWTEFSTTFFNILHEFEIELGKRIRVKTWAQCSKTFCVRDLRIFVIS